jgi:gas vesicle protein
MMRRAKCILIGMLIGAAIGFAFALLINPPNSYRGYIVQTMTGVLVGAVIGFLMSLRR